MISNKESRLASHWTIRWFPETPDNTSEACATFSSQYLLIFCLYCTRSIFSQLITCWAEISAWMIQTLCLDHAPGPKLQLQNSDPPTRLMVGEQSNGEPLCQHLTPALLVFEWIDYVDRTPTQVPNPSNAMLVCGPEQRQGMFSQWDQLSSNPFNVQGEICSCHLVARRLPWALRFWHVTRCRPCIYTKCSFLFFCFALIFTPPPPQRTNKESPSLCLHH